MNNHTVKYVYPLDFQKAKKHRLANRIFKGKIQPNSQQCQCCGKKIGQEIVQTTCNIQSNKFSFMGPGVPLFFLYLRLVIVLLLIMSVLFMGFAIYSNVSTSCGSSSCSSDVFQNLSIMSKLSNATYMEIQSYLALAFVLICVLFFHYFRLKARQLEQQCDQVIDSPSDYAIILRRLPPDVTEGEINEIIRQKKESLSPQQLSKTLNLQVNKIILSYSLHQYNKAKIQNDQDFKLCISQNRYSQFKPKDLPKPIKSSSIAVVVFESQAAKDYFIYKPNIFQKIVQSFCSPCTPLSEFTIRDKRIGVERAPQPDDIFWQNSGITIYGGICRKLGTGIISIIILFIGGGAQYGFNLLSSTVTDSTNKSILNIGSSLIVTVFNAILMVVLSTLTSKQRNQTLTEFQAVLMVKITLFQFLNAGVFVVLSQYAANYSTFTLANGMSSQITLIMIFNAIIPNITLFILEYFEIINKILILCVEKGWKICNQKELNELSIGSQIEISKKYAYILKTLWLTALFSPFIPVVVGISMIGLLIFYFVEKFLYTKSYSIPNTVSSVTFESSTELLEYFLITFSLGQLIIYFYFYSFQYESIPMRWTATILATITLAVLNSALPMQSINQYFFKIPNSTHSNLSYSQVEQRFQVTYQMTNPAYQSKRQRKNIKDFIVLSNQTDSKAVAIEMTNLFNASVTKNNESMMTQKPLLSEYLQKKQDKQDTPKSRQIQILISYNNQEGRQKEKSKQQVREMEVQRNKQIPQAKNDKEQPRNNQLQVVDKQPKVQSRPVLQVQQPKQQKPTLGIRSTQAVQQAQPNQQNKPKEGSPLNQSFITQKIKQSASYSMMTKPDIDPLDDNLQKYPPPKFVLKWREEQQKLNAKKSKQKEKEEQKVVKQQPKMPKLTNQSQNAKIQKTNIEINYDNIFSTSKPQKIKEIKQQIPIASKYHASNGKVNIYDQFKDPSHPISLKFFSKKGNMSKKKAKEVEIPNKMNLSDPKPKQKFQYLIVKEVKKNEQEKDQFKEFQSINSEENTVNLLGPQRTEPSSKKVSKKQLQLAQKAINDVFIDTFGQNSNVSSIGDEHYNNDEQVNRRYKLNQIQFKDQNKQKRATYNPIPITGGYKKYFNNKSQQKKHPYQGFLNKKLVMSYLGTPFMNLERKTENSKNKPK